MCSTGPSPAGALEAASAPCDRSRETRAGSRPSSALPPRCGESTEEKRLEARSAGKLRPAVEDLQITRLQHVLRILPAPAATGQSPREAGSVQPPGLDLPFGWRHRSALHVWSGSGAGVSYDMVAHSTANSGARGRPNRRLRFARETWSRCELEGHRGLSGRGRSGHRRKTPGSRRRRPKDGDNPARPYENTTPSVGAALAAARIRREVPFPRHQSLQQHAARADHQRPAPGQ